MAQNVVITNDFLINFYNSIKQLVHTKSIVSNRIVEITKQYKTPEGKIDFTKMEEQEKQEFLAELRTLKYWISQSYTYYNAIRKKLGKGEDETITRAIKPLKENLVPKDDDLEAYCSSLLTLLLDETMTDLLKTSQDQISKIYGSPQQNATTKPTKP